MTKFTYINKKDNKSKIVIETEDETKANEVLAGVVSAGGLTSDWTLKTE